MLIDFIMFTALIASLILAHKAMFKSSIFCGIVFVTCLYFFDNVLVNVLEDPYFIKIEKLIFRIYQVIYIIVAANAAMRERFM